MPKDSLRESVSSNLIQALRQKRLDKGFSMRAVAERTGLHVSHISLVEREMRKPTLDTLLRIAEALEVELWPIMKRASETAARH